MGEGAHGQAEKMKTRVFWVPKGRASPDEHEDAFAFSEHGAPVSGAPFRLAVADGATEAAFARRWAQLLAEGFITHGADVLAEKLPAVQDEWQTSVDSQSGTFPWYTAAKAEAGAFAALLGLALRPAASGAGGTWRAASVGDCNLFHLHASHLRRAWPRAQSEDFHQRPALLPSRPNNAQPPAVRRAEGPFAPGSAFVLATDAAAAWLLRTDPAEALRWNGQATFAEAVRSARAAGTLNNDDTTVAVIEVV